MAGPTLNPLFYIIGAKRKRREKKKERINRVEDVLTLGDKVTVVCLGKDKMGRISFSMKDVAQV